jgi:hypothetical protein
MCGGVALDGLRSPALIHLAALQFRRLPAGIDPLDFDADRPHQRCERGHDRELAVRLALIGRELREELVQVTPAEAVSLVSAKMGLVFPWPFPMQSGCRSDCQ